MTWVIFRRELLGYFQTPIAYVFMVIFIFLTGIFTFKISGFYEVGQADLRTFFFWHPWLYLFLVPAVSMRLWAEERKSGTIELLFTLPVSPFSAIVGKFLAGWVFLGLSLLLTLPMVFTVHYLGNPDSGVIVASYLASFMMGGAYLGIGSGFSALTKNQVISFILTVVACLAFMLIGFAPFVKFLTLVLPDTLVEVLPHLSFIYHFEGIQKGIFDLSDLFYFVSVMVLGLYATHVILEDKKAI